MLGRSHTAKNTLQIPWRLSLSGGWILCLPMSRRPVNRFPWVRGDVWARSKPVVSIQNQNALTRVC